MKLLSFQGKVRGARGLLEAGTCQDVINTHLTNDPEFGQDIITTLGNQRYTALEQTLGDSF